MPVAILKLHGLKCPLPVLKARKVLEGMKAGEVIQIECTDPLAAIDIPAFVQQSGNILMEVERLPNSVIAFRIEKGPRL